ncbi:putative RNA-directed DNA polymerase [Helianthus annuus]|nr:putative RNA-directed DNA polymerase [Helianthus annuus]
MSKHSPMRFDVEKYGGKINFGLWQVQVKDVLIQSGLHKALRGKPAPVLSKDSSRTSKDDDEEWEALDLRAASAIRLCLAKNVLANVHGISTAKDLWEKLEQLYQGKGISNRLYLKEQFHTLRMDGDTKFQII